MSSFQQLKRWPLIVLFLFNFFQAQQVDASCPANVVETERVIRALRTKGFSIESILAWDKFTWQGKSYDFSKLNILDVQSNFTTKVKDLTDGSKIVISDLNGQPRILTLKLESSPSGTRTPVLYEDALGPSNTSVRVRRTIDQVVSTYTPKTVPSSQGIPTLTANQVTLDSTSISSTRPVILEMADHADPRYRPFFPPPNAGRFTLNPGRSLKDNVEGFNKHVKGTRGISNTDLRPENPPPLFFRQVDGDSIERLLKTGIEPPRGSSFTYQSVIEKQAKTLAASQGISLGKASEVARAELLGNWVRAADLPDNLENRAYIERILAMKPGEKRNRAITNLLGREKVEDAWNLYPSWFTPFSPVSSTSLGPHYPPNSDQYVLVIADVQKRGRLNTGGGYEGEWLFWGGIQQEEVVQILTKDEFDRIYGDLFVDSAKLGDLRWDYSQFDAQKNPSLRSPASILRNSDDSKWPLKKEVTLH